MKKLGSKCSSLRKIAKNAPERRNHEKKLWHQHPAMYGNPVRPLCRQLPIYVCRGHTEELSIAPAEAGREKKLYQYCLKEKDGCVYVYFADGKTIYEPTSISLAELPKNIRKKIKKGLYLLDDRELYSFLENYSS